MPAVQVVEPEAEVVEPMPRYAIAVKTSWTAPWGELDYVNFLDATDTVGPGISTAQFEFDWGRVSREDRQDWQTKTRINLDHRDLYVRVKVLGAHPYTLFVGKLQANAESIEDDVTVGGVDVDSGSQTFTAYGLADKLNDKVISRSHFERQGIVARIDRVLEFNERYPSGGRVRGNRSASQYDLGNGREAYLFGTDVDTMKVWTYRNIVESLLALFGPDDMAFELSGQADVLSLLEDAPGGFDGETCKMAIDELISPAFGMGYYIPMKDEGTQEVRVFTLNDTPISAGGATLPANPQQAQIQLQDSTNPQAVEVVKASQKRRHKLLVRGGLIMSCQAFRYSDGTLSEGWRAEDQTAYDAAGDAQRGATSLERVYVRHILKKTFSPNPEQCPRLDATATLVPEIVAEWYRPGKTFANRLPLLKGYDYVTGGRAGNHLSVTDTNDAQEQPEYLEPMAFVQDENGVWQMVDKLGQIQKPAASVRMLSHDLGVEIRPPYNHAYAKNTFAGSTDPGTPAEIDYTTLIITVAVETDERLQIEHRISDFAPAERDAVIDVADAEFHWIAAKTPVGVENGVLQLSAGGIIRSDAALLRAVTAVAAKWYGQERNSIEYNEDGIVPVVTPGTLILDAATGRRKVPVGTVVTMRRWDATRQLTTITTEYFELQFAGLVRQLSDRKVTTQSPRSVQRAVKVLTADVKVLMAQPTQPVRQPIGYGTGGSTNRWGSFTVVE